MISVRDNATSQEEIWGSANVVVRLLAGLL